MLSPEASAEPGQWRTARVPYTREIMDTVGRYRETVWMASAQVAKTEICLNTLGYYMSQDPAPSMLVEPTIDMAEAISKDRIAPMLRDTPILNGLVKDRRSKDSENAILHKSFPGGQLTMSGANSPASLRSRPKRFMLLDEIDAYPFSAGAEGDPVTLAVKRTVTFWNRRIFYVSTPTIKGVSRIEKLWEKSDKRYYFVPCPHCSKEQRFVWERVKWEEEKDSDRVTAWYECEHCEGRITDAHKPAMLAAGRWVATERKNSVPGFHIWEAYSPWVKFHEIVRDYLDAKDDKNQLQAFWNTSLGLPFEQEGGEALQWRQLMARAEPYRPLSVPRGALLLTAGVDVQANRLECSIWGWGRGEEAWLIYHVVLYGDPLQEEVWEQLDAILGATYTHESGELAISAMAIDTGYLPDRVYSFTRKRARCYAVAGSTSAGRPVVGRPSLQEVKGTNGKPLKKGVSRWPVGTDTVKSAIYARLRLAEPRAGYLHFYQGVEDEYFQQLCAEKVVTKFLKGYPKREWVKIRPRNEALDCLVYAYAAAHLAGLLRINWDKLEAALFPPPPAEEKKDPPPSPPPRERKPWVDRERWRNFRDR
ncbi:phage terminase large subunit family protein [Pannus brasiliensis CCIBt3594]|uniref:Phage terminase large subunit family protein n=1 Tax=Pannus brasiliensis CCIBt3594 TaxID=1427578 RepID=A0AAW9QRM7_9CHRO